MNCFPRAIHSAFVLTWIALLRFHYATRPYIGIWSPTRKFWRERSYLGLSVCCPYVLSDLASEGLIGEQPADECAHDVLRGDT